MQTLVGCQEFLLNEGFDARKKQLGNSSIVNCEIPLNRYSFFEVFKDKMLPDSRFELNIEFESDNNLIWREGNDVCRVIITKLQLYMCKIRREVQNNSSKILDLF